MSKGQTVYVVDDDRDVRDGIAMLLRSVHLRVKAFDSAEAFLEAFDASVPACLVLDVRMSGMGGMELLKQLQTEAPSITVIMLTGHGDVPMAVRALKVGAFDFFEKPFSQQSLIERVQEALVESESRLERQTQRDDVGGRLAQLTRRQHDVLDLVLKGLSNKVIAQTLKISEKTVEIHRQRVMQKMQVKHVAELTRLVLQQGDRN